MRQIALYIETTGMPAVAGHRIIEIGAVEMVNDRLTGNLYHEYINPTRAVDNGAFEAHGLGRGFLADKPVMSAVIDDFLSFIRDAELIIHHAPFVIGFLDKELKLAGKTQCITDVCRVTDTLTMARKRLSGQRLNLPFLAKYYGVDTTGQYVRASLTNATILANVYCAMKNNKLQ